MKVGFVTAEDASHKKQSTALPHITPAQAKVGYLSGLHQFLVHHVLNAVPEYDAATDLTLRIRSYVCLKRSKEFCDEEAENELFTSSQRYSLERHSFYF
ncbi:hypothetical protein J6590_083630 [Homalodisca vitripennis]|nr:hypothetical protein J6590_083630 [Homalodisca vitripennis]